MSNGAALLLPDNRNRSSTAVQNRSDARSDNIYSSIVVGDSAAGQTKAFTVPQGQAIPRLMGSAIAPTSPHQLIHTEGTTNFSKAGEAGSSIGDFSVRAIGITLENAFYSAAGVQNAYGMGQQEVTEVLNKTFFQLKIGGKKMAEGATWMFPASGGQMGAIATTGNAATVSALSNGWPGAPRRLQMPILVARTDTIEGVFGVDGSDTLDFTTATGQGNSSLVWFNLWSLIKGDAR